MEEHTLTFTGYQGTKVRETVKIIRENAHKFNVDITGKPVKEKKPLRDQPKLHGCDVKDLTIYSLNIKGELPNVRDLVNMDTPFGIMINLLPLQSA